MMKYRYPIIDIHTHILPAFDDGSRSLEESVTLLKAAAEQGVTAAIATPHCFRQRENKDPEEAVSQLMEMVRKELPGFKLYPGHETFYHEGIVAQLQSNDAKTLAGSRWVLVEFSPSVSYTSLFRGIRRIQEGGYRPLLAHCERYVCLRTEGRIEELMKARCRLQMNYDSLSGPWYRPEIRWCRKQVMEGRIFALGSDMHRMDFRPPDITPALNWLEKHLTPQAVKALVYENPARILREQNGGVSLVFDIKETKEKR